MEPGVLLTVQNTILAKLWYCDQRRCWWHCDFWFHHCICSHAVHQTSSSFFFSQYTLKESRTPDAVSTCTVSWWPYCVWGAVTIHKLCFSCSTVNSFFFLRYYLTDICCPPTDEWSACGQVTPAWRHISFGRFLNWQTLCLRDGMKTNEHRQTVVNGAS